MFTALTKSYLYLKCFKTILFMVTSNGKKSPITAQVINIIYDTYSHNIHPLKSCFSKLRIGSRPKQTFLQRRYTDCQQTRERMLNITNHWRNANQNYNEVSPHTS